MKKIFSVFVLILFLFSAVVHAQSSLPDPGILPDSAFYGIKRAFESIGNVFAFGETSKTERALSLAEKRLAEAEAMAAKGKPEYLDKLSQDYEDHIEKANEISALARDASKKEQLAELVSKATLQHLTVLDMVQERVPEQAKERIAVVRERAIKGNQEALKALARENPERSAEIAMEAAESRAKKAREAAEIGNEEETIKAVEEYEKYLGFGEEISAIAQEVGKDPSKVNELVAQATSLHITVLEEVLGIVPEEAKSRIQDTIVSSEAGRDSAVEAFEEREIPVPEIARKEKPETDSGMSPEIPSGIRP